MKLTEQDAKQLYDALSSAHKADLHQSYSATLLKHPNTGRPRKLLRTTPKDLVALCVSMLRTAVAERHVKLRLRADLDGTPHPRSVE
jgi:hypothetical protein